MLKFMLVHNDIQIWHLIVLSHVRKSLYINIDFNMDFTLCSRPLEAPAAAPYVEKNYTVWHNTLKFNFNLISAD